MTEALLWSPQGFADAAAYLRFLGAMLAAHLQLGLPAAARRGVDAEMMRERRALCCLCEDLRLPSAPLATLLTGHSADHAWGVAYGLIGSSLGARHILRSGTLRPEWPVAYLTACAQTATSGEVRHFFDALNAAGPDITEAMRGADDVFDLIARHASAAAAPAPDLMKDHA